MIYGDLGRRGYLGLHSSKGRRYSISMESGFQCAGCGEWNETVVDPSAGALQSYVEDCQVCCKPNVLTARRGTAGEFAISAELE